MNIYTVTAHRPMTGDKSYRFTTLGNALRAVEANAKGSGSRVSLVRTFEPA